MKKTGKKFMTLKCGRCGDKHSGYSGKLDSKGVEYVVCGRTHKRSNIRRVGIDQATFPTIWVEETKES